MNRDDHSPTDPTGLRHRAEVRLGPSRASTHLDSDVGRLGRELQVHRAELELQNEELRHNELALATSLDRYRSLFDWAPIGCVVLDEGGRVIEANLTLCRWLGLARGGITGRPLSALMSEAHADAFGRSVTAVLDGAATQACEVELCRGDGSRVRVRLESSRSHASSQGQVVTAAIDVSNERRLEAELQQISKLRAIDTLAAGIAHDFRNLLHGIAGAVALAAHEPGLPARVSEQLEQIRDATRRGAALTDQITAFSRRKDADEPRPVVLDAFVEEVAPLLRRLLGEQIRVVLEPGAAGAAVMADPVQLQRILMNLASNARDAMPTGGNLVIHTEVVTIDEGDPRRRLVEASGPYVQLTVRDTGTGMDEATRQRIFEPFFTTKDVGKGTGLGLSSVYGITRKLGGHVEVESELWVGTAFTFWLPRSADLPVCETTGPHVAVSLSGMVLLVEDDPLVRAAIRADLEGLGMTVAEASDGNAALALVETVEPAPTLLVTDVMMPDMIGARLAELLRARLPALRVLLVSAHSAEQLVEQGTVPPGSSVLRKPFDRAALASRLVELLATADDAAAADMGSLEGATVLLVDDDVGGRDALAELLELEGLYVLTARDAECALRTAETHGGPIDLLLTDLCLPQMQGNELACRLRELRPGLGVMFVSGAEPSSDITLGEVCMRKPVEVDDLVATMRPLLGRRKPFAQPPG